MAAPRVDTPYPTLVVSNYDMSGSDVAFTFNANTERAIMQCSASTSSLYFAAASSGHAGFVLPVGGTLPGLELRFWEISGLVCTLNGTNGTNVQIIEHLRHA